MAQSACGAEWRATEPQKWMSREDALKVVKPNPDRCTRDDGGRGIGAGFFPAHHVPKRGEVGGFHLSSVPGVSICAVSVFSFATPTLTLPSKQPQTLW